MFQYKYKKIYDKDYILYKKIIKWEKNSRK